MKKRKAAKATTRRKIHPQVDSSTFGMTTGSGVGSESQETVSIEIRISPGLAGPAVILKGRLGDWIGCAQARRAVFMAAALAGRRPMTLDLSALSGGEAPQLLVVARTVQEFVARGIPVRMLLPAGRIAATMLKRLPLGQIRECTMA